MQWLNLISQSKGNVHLLLDERLIRDIAACKRWCRSCLSFFALETVNLQSITSGTDFSNDLKLWRDALSFLKFQVFVFPHMRTSLKCCGSPQKKHDFRIFQVRHEITNGLAKVIHQSPENTTQITRRTRGQETEVAYETSYHESISPNGQAVFAEQCEHAITAAKSKSAPESVVQNEVSTQSTAKWERARGTKK